MSNQNNQDFTDTVINEVLLQNYIDLQMIGTFKIDQPQGILEMAKQVRLVVGEGADKIEVGVATVEKKPNGDAVVSLTITNSALIKALGGTEVKGIITKFGEIEEDTSE